MIIGSCGEPKASTDTLALNKNTGTSEKRPRKPLSQEFKAYWYSGEAEITSYALKQPRYGQIRKGHAVLIYVTEPFSAQKQVKADNPDASNIPVLKLNSTKKYLTGIYPYSLMSSTFYPVHDNGHALKVSFSWSRVVWTGVCTAEQP